MKLIPDFYFDGVCAITVDFLNKQGIKGLLLDVDNTLAPDQSQLLSDEVKGWLASMREAGIAAVVLSNNHEPRVKPFAESIGLKYIIEAEKPSLKKLPEALSALGVEREEAAVVGDQLFTDVLFGNRAGMTSILVEAVGEDVDKFVKFKRIFERPFRKKIIRLRHTPFVAADAAPPSPQRGRLDDRKDNR